MPSWIWWLILAAYAVGWALSIPGALRRRMLGLECPKCGSSMCDIRSHGKDEVRGSLRDRRGSDVAVAIVRAVFWPIRMVVVFIGAMFRLGGRGVVAAVNRVTPLTGPELARRMAEQEREIARLTAQINERTRCTCGKWQTYMGIYDRDGYTLRCHGCLRAIANCRCR
jgi:hypothetical protein